MTITLLAPDGVPLTAKQERQAKAAQHGGGAGRPLGGRSGFRVDTASNILTATSTTWTLQPCSAMLDPGALTDQGMYGWASNANVTGSVTAADATYARKDIVYIQVNDSTAGDSSGEVTADVKYLAGPADGTNAPPALPPRSFLVGTLSVPIAGGGSPTVVLNPVKFVAAGGILQVYTVTERDALSPYEGFTIRRMDVIGTPLEVYRGGGWKDEPDAKGLVYRQIVTTNSNGITDGIIANWQSVTFKGGRKYKITWDVGYSITVNGNYFYLSINTANPLDPAGQLTGLTVVDGATKTAATAGAAEHFTVFALYEPTVDTTIQIKFRAQRTVGGGAINILGAQEKAKYMLDDMGAQF